MLTKFADPSLFAARISFVRKCFIAKPNRRPPTAHHARVGPNSATKRVAASCMDVPCIAGCEPKNDPLLVLRAIEKVCHEYGNVRLHVQQSRQVLSVTFNLNYFYERQLLTNFRFNLPEMKKISDAICFTGVTSRSHHICEPIVA